MDDYENLSDNKELKRPFICGILLEQCDNKEY